MKTPSIFTIIYQQNNLLNRELLRWTPTNKKHTASSYVMCRYGFCTSSKHSTTVVPSTVLPFQTLERKQHTASALMQQVTGNPGKSTTIFFPPIALKGTSAGIKK